MTNVLLVLLFPVGSLAVLAVVAGAERIARRERSQR